MLFVSLYKENGKYKEFFFTSRQSSLATGTAWCMPISSDIKNTLQ